MPAERAVDRPDTATEAAPSTARPVFWRAAAAAAAAVSLFAAILALHAVTPDPSIAAIESAMRDTLAGPGPQPLSDEPDTPVTLPDRWRDSCNDCRRAWYEVLVPGDARVLYVPHAAQSFAAYAQGERLSGTLKSIGSLARPDGAPQLLRLPTVPNAQPVTLLLEADRPGHGSLSVVYAADLADVATHYRLRHLLRTGMPRLSLVFCLIVGLLLAALWAQQRHRAEYGWLAALAVAWGVQTLPSIATQGTASALAASPTARWIEAGLLALLAVLISRVAAVIGRNRGAIGRTLALVAAMGLAALALVAVAAPTLLDAVLPAWQVLWLIAVGVAAVPMMATVSGRTARTPWLVFPAAVVALFALRDAAVASGLVGSLDRDTLYFAAPVFLGCLAWLLLTQFIDTLRSTEAMNVELDRLVREKTDHIEDQYRRMRALERERILANERERIMRDMHDGVGGQLVSAIAMLDGGGADQLRGALSGALTDMRLMIDSLESVGDDLNAVLAMFRDRAQPLLSAAGIGLTWRVEDLPPVAHLGPSSVLSILRIMQETVTNTLKHADAANVVVSARASDGQDTVDITLSDDGAGFDAGAGEGAGYGLRNMRSRAAAHGIDLSLTTSPGNGTRVRLRIPVSRP